MASSSSKPSSTSSSSSTTSTPSAARDLPTRAAAPAASAAHGVAPGATATASASATGVAPSAIASVTAAGVAPSTIASASASGVSRSIPLPPRLPKPAGFTGEHRRGDRARNAAGVYRPRNSVAVSQHVSLTSMLEQGWQTAADPTSTLAPSKWSTEGSSPSTSAWSKPLPGLSTMASTPTNTRPASAATSSTTPSPNAAPEPEPHAFASSTSSAPGVTTSADPALKPDATIFTTPSATGMAKIVEAEQEPDASVERGPEQQAFGGNGMPPVEPLSPGPLCPWREELPARLLSFGEYQCWACGNRPARVQTIPCYHLAICVRCYCNVNNRLVCPSCGLHINWILIL